MSRHARGAIPSAYTPHHMDVAMQRRSVGMTDVCQEARTLVTWDDIASQTHTGTRLRHVPHLRERSVE